MSSEGPPTARDRLYACEGASVVISYGAHPAGVVSPAGHLGIQTSGYSKVDLDAILPILHDLPETFDLEFLGPVRDEHLRHLVGLTNILRLNLGYGQVTDEGLQYLSGLKNLRVLELSRQPITGQGTWHLSDLTNLRRLELGWTQVDDDGLEALAHLGQLTHLDLPQCPVTDRGLKHLRQLTNLETLDLSGTRVTGAGLADVARLESLRSLSLDQLPIGDADAACLATLTRLQSLRLYRTQIGDRGAAWLSHLPCLGWVYLGGTRITDDALRHLRGCAGLINLALDGTAVTGESFAHLPEGLRVLSLSGTQVRPEFLSNLRHLKQLDTLCLDPATADDAACQALRELGLGPVSSGSADTAAFRRFRKCPLCRDAITDDGPVFVARPFALGSEFLHLVKAPMHWDCYARWEQRPRFARRYFDANVEAARHNQFWGIARCAEQMLVTVNPTQYVREIEVLLAVTGSSFRLHLDDWQDWLDGEWFEHCRHEAERAALAPLIPSLRADLPTPQAVVEAAGMSADAIGQKSALEEQGGMVERVSYEFACQELAERAARKGIACPYCGHFSNDYDYCRVEMVSEDGPQSHLICKNCEDQFGPTDV